MILLFACLFLLFIFSHLTAGITAAVPYYFATIPVQVQVPWCKRCILLRVQVQ